MDITTHLTAVLATMLAATGANGPAGGIPGAPPAGPHDHIEGLHCPVTSAEYCRLDGTRPLAEILRDHTPEELPATRVECLIDARDQLMECADVPMDWPEIVSEEDAQERETMARYRCAPSEITRELVCLDPPGSNATKKQGGGEH